MSPTSRRWCGLSMTTPRGRRRSCTANGVTAESVAGAIDGRPARLEVRRGEERLLARALQYDAVGQIAGDGERLYSYDRLGRLAGADSFQFGSSARGDWQYEYDEMDNLRRYARAARQHAFCLRPVWAGGVCGGRGGTANAVYV